MGRRAGEKLGVGRGMQRVWCLCEVGETGPNGGVEKVERVCAHSIQKL